MSLHHGQEIFYAIQGSSHLDVWGIITSVATVVAAISAAISAWIMKEAQKDKFVPILMPNESSWYLQKDKSIPLELINVGKGMAKDVYLYYEGKVIEGNFTILPEESRNFSAPADDKMDRIAEMWSGDKSVCYWTIEYCDIYGRKFSTKIMFTKDAVRDHFFLDRGKWEWSRI